MTIFDHIQEQRYFDYCYALTKCKNNAHDLLMNVALEIYERDYALDYPYTLFQRIAKHRFIDGQKTKYLPLEIDVEQPESIDEIDTGIVYDILNTPPRSKRQFVTNEIFKLYLQLKTEQAVADYTGIKRTTIHSQIQKFKNYVREIVNNQ